MDRLATTQGCRRPRGWLSRSRIAFVGIALALCALLGGCVDILVETALEYALKGDKGGSSCAGLPLADVAPQTSIGYQVQSTSPEKTRPELVLQTGHAKAINAVAFSPDGRSLASGSWDNTVKLWDVATGRELRSLTGHTSFVNSVAFSPDGRWLASGSSTVKLWDVATGAELFTNTGTVHSIAFSPNGRLLALGGWGVELWDFVTRVELCTLHLKTTITAVAFSPDGRTLASGGWDNTVKLWNAATGRELRTLTGHTGFVNSVAFSPDGRWLASGSDDGTVKLWDVGTGREVRTLSGHTNGVKSVAFSPDGRWLASGGVDGTVKLWDVATGRELRSLTGHTKSVNAVTFSPDERWLASGSRDKTIKLWDAATGRELRSLSGHRSNLKAVAFSPDGRWLASGGWDQPIELWEVATGIELRSWGYGRGGVNAVTFSPDGRWLASGQLELKQPVKIWDVATGKELRTLTGYADYVEAVAFSPDGRWLASGGQRWDKTIKRNESAIDLWDVATGKKLHTLMTGHSQDIMAVAFSPDGRSLASGSSGGDEESIKLWDVATGKELRTLTGYAEWIDSVAFSPDGRWLASGGVVGTVKLWDVATGKELRTFTGHTRIVKAVTFSPDGRWLASGSTDSTVKLWDVATGTELRTLKLPLEVWAVAFSPDGRWLASGSDDGSIRIWDPSSGEPLATLVSLGKGTEWLVVTPDGLFDGSPAAWDKILWRFGGNTFDVTPVEIFFNEFYYPGLLADIFAGKKPKAPKDISQIDRRQPQVKLSLADGQSSSSETVSARTIRVRLEVAEAPPDKKKPEGSGARDVRLFRNGSLVKVWGGNVLRNKSERTVLETTVPIVAGGNRLTAYAFNRDNIKSEDATLVVTGAESLRRKGTAYILAVGINQYANEDYNLRYAGADAQAFSSELKRQQTNLGTFADVEVISLLDKDATKANILAALERLGGIKTRPLPPGAPPVLRKIKPAQPEDAVFVYYAGHGTAHGARFYLIPHDLGYSGSRTVLDEAGLKTILAHSISDLELERAFEKLDAGRLLLVIDACNSGQALEAEEKRRGPMNSKGLAQLAYEKGMYILTAAQGYQAALEAVQLGHGLLTYALVEEGLKTSAADVTPKDGQVVVREWMDYTTLRVPQLQIAIMKEGQRQGREIAFVDGEEKTRGLEDRTLQRPRAFYRRERESSPLVVAKP